MSENGPGSTIVDLSESAPELARELAQARAELEETRAQLAELKAKTRYRVPRKGERPIWKDQRWAMCRCGHVDLYPCGRSKRGPGSSFSDPARMKNQKCIDCRRTLEAGANRRAMDKLTLAERRLYRQLYYKVARQQRTLEVSLSLGRGSPGSEEKPLQRSASAVARRASSPTGSARKRLEQHEKQRALEEQRAQFLAR